MGGQLYQARLIDFDGITQGMGNESDNASFNLGNADEEYVEVLSADPENQTFTAVFAKDPVMGATVCPTIWPTPILN